MSCKGCKKRVVNCHSTCPDYHLFMKTQAEIKEKQKNYTEIEKYITASAIRNRDKRIKKLNLQKKNY